MHPLLASCTVEQAGQLGQGVQTNVRIFREPLLRADHRIEHPPRNIVPIDLFVLVDLAPEHHT